MPYDVKQVIVIRRDLNMRKGKIGAMCGHASMAFVSKQIRDSNYGKDGWYAMIDSTTHCINVAISDIQLKWMKESFAKIVVYVNSEQELLDLIAKGKEAGIVVHEIIDNGATEFHGVPTLTCAAFGPDKSDKLDLVTGGLPLL